MKTLFTVYNPRCAGYLMMNGFPLRRITMDNKTGRRDYLFPNSEKLREHIEKWQELRVKTKQE